MKVYTAFTSDGDQFDGCVALNEDFARAVIQRRYSQPGRAFVGGKHRTHASLREHMTIRESPEIDPTAFLFWAAAAEQAVNPPESMAGTAHQQLMAAYATAFPKRKA